VPNFVNTFTKLNGRCIPTSYFLSAFIVTYLLFLWVRAGYESTSSSTTVTIGNLLTF